MGIQDTDPLSQLTLPPGFRFYPTDEELLVQYLCRKVAGHHFALQIIAEIDLYKFDPWVLPSKALFGEKEWYFFSPRDRKYPNGSRPNRVAGSGYWKATGTDKIITTEGRKVGIKKALVFYVGKAPKGTKTNWIMHEYRLSDPPKTNASSRLDEWVLCRIYKKNSSGVKPVFTGMHSIEHSHGSSSSSSSQFDDMLESLTETDQDQYFSLPKMNNSLRTFQQQDDQKPLNLQHLGSGNIDWASLAGLSTLPELGQGNQAPVHVNNHNINNNLSNVNDFFTHPATLNFHGYTTKLGGVVDEEVQSGIRNRQLDNLGFFQHQNSNGFSNSVDPFGIRYPDHTVNPLYRQ